MDVQFVEPADAVMRTLLEVYASLALNTVEHNSFFPAAMQARPLLAPVRDLT